MERFAPGTDERLPSVRVEYGIARAELEQKASVRAAAAMHLAIHDVLAEARAYPELFVPLALCADADAVDFAVRGAVLDLAVRMSVAENTIRAYDHTATTLLSSGPQLWHLFREGEISLANVRAAADILSTLPESLHGEFEDAAVAAAQLAPSKFKTRMRAVREAIQPDADERHRIAADERRTWIDRDLDGMSTVAVYGPAAACERAAANIDRIARHLSIQLDETRTLAQIRSDVALDLLAGKLGAVRASSGSGSDGVGISVGLTIPIMTMLGHSDEPALLEGYGPIDAQTARELAKDATEFTRILTHPITGAIVDVDNPGYRPTASQDRVVKTRDAFCTTPGCSKPAVNCDLDHTIAWPSGPTAVDNLKPLCRNHHRVKHKTLWKSQQDADGKTTWTSPTGFVRDADPPPF